MVDRQGKRPKIESKRDEGRRRIEEDRDSRIEME